MNDLSGHRRMSLDISLQVLDAAARRGDLLRKQQARHEVVAAVARTLLLIVAIGAVWTLLSPAVPLPSALIGHRAADLLPFIPIGVGLWIFHSANRRSAELDEIEHEFIEDEIDSIKRILAHP